MKTVSEVAKELKVSPQAIYKKINNQLKNQLKKHIYVTNGKTLIDSKGIEIIKNSMSENIKPEQPTVDNGLMDILQEQIKVKDEQIQSLLQKIENMQVLLKNEQQKTVLLLESNENKGFWNRLLGKEKRQNGER